MIGYVDATFYAHVEPKFSVNGERVEVIAEDPA